MNNFNANDSLSLLEGKSVLRSPRAIVVINDIAVRWMDITITNNTFFVADLFRVEIPLNGQPAPIDFSYWASATLFTVHIYIGFPKDPQNYTTQDLDLLMSGDVTDFDLDPLRAIVTLHGRDLSSRLIDKKITKNYSNYLSSQLAQQFATDNNLTPIVTPTNTLVGTFFYNQQNLLANNTTQWDLLTFVAQQENFVCYVKGENLYYQPLPTEANHSQLPFVLQYQPPIAGNPTPVFNGTTLSISKTVMISGDVSVTIKVPYNSQTGQAFSITETSTYHSRNHKAPVAKKTRYVHSYVGLTQDQARQKAKQLLMNYTQHANRVYAVLPGENSLQKDSLIQLLGTDTALDQIYYPEEIIRKFSPENGYTMQVSARNKSADASIN